MIHSWVKLHKLRLHFCPKTQSCTYFRKKYYCTYSIILELYIFEICTTLNQYVQHCSRPARNSKTQKSVKFGSGNNNLICFEIRTASKFHIEALGVLNQTFFFNFLRLVGVVGLLFANFIKNFQFFFNFLDPKNYIDQFKINFMLLKTLKRFQVQLIGFISGFFNLFSR